MQGSILALLATAVTVMAVPMPMPIAVSVPGAMDGVIRPNIPQPGIPTAAAAKTQLASLKVRTGADATGYVRDLFPTWDTISGSCNTR